MADKKINIHFAYHTILRIAVINECVSLQLLLLCLDEIMVLGGVTCKRYLSFSSESEPYVTFQKEQRDLHNGAEIVIFGMDSCPKKLVSQEEFDAVFADELHQPDDVNLANKGDEFTYKMGRDKYRIKCVTRFPRVDVYYYDKKSTKPWPNAISPTPRCDLARNFIEKIYPDTDSSHLSP